MCNPAELFPFGPIVVLMPFNLMGAGRRAPKEVSLAIMHNTIVSCFRFRLKKLDRDTKLRYPIAARFLSTVLFPGVRAPDPLLKEEGMKRFVTMLSLLALCLLASTSFAANLRNPQVVFDYGPLQGDLNSLGETSINVASAQMDVQVWSSNILGNSDFSIAFKNGSGDEVGVYNGSNTAQLFMVFPSGAAAGWYAQVHFGAGATMSVTLFDGVSPTPQGTTTYTGVNKSLFGFYIKNQSGTFYSQDDFNLSGAQVLTYAGVANPGDWWLCFQDSMANPASTYTSVVMAIESVRPTPTSNPTWGKIKSRYR